ASVAISRARVTPRFFILSRQMPSASTARAIRLADAAGGGNALAQPDDAGERIDHAKAVAGRTRNQQPAVVGAEVERRIGPALPAIAIGARVAIRGSPTPRSPPARPAVTRRAEAPVIPGLVVHRMPSCRDQSSRSTGPAMSKFDYQGECNSAAPSR